MAITVGPNSGNANAASVGQADPSAVDPTDAQAQADAKAQNLKSDGKALTNFDQNVKDGRAAEGDREVGLLGRGVTSLAQTDGVAKPGLQTLFQVFAAPAGEVQQGEVSNEQALGAFSPLQSLLGKPQSGDSASAIALGNPQWPLTPMPGQTQLLGLSTSNEFMNLNVDTSGGAEPPPVTGGAKSKLGSAASADTAAGQAAGKPDPQIVSRVAFVQRLASLTQRTFAAQLDPQVKQQIAVQLGKKALGILQPFADQMPALHEAIKSAFSAMNAQTEAGAAQVEVPPQALSQIEGAIGAAFGKADGFVSALKTNSAQVMPIIQKMQQGDSSAFQAAPPHIQALVQGVVSWNSAKGEGTFPGTNLGGATSAQVGAEAAGNDITGVTTGGGATIITISTGSAAFAGSDPFGGTNFAGMDINSLIFMVMSEASDEQTSELEDTITALQNNTNAKAAQREKQEALQNAQTQMKSSIDNTYYQLIEEGPANGGILEPPQGPTMTQFENSMQVTWGDGQNVTDNNGNPTGEWLGPTPSWQCPNPMPSAWSTPPAPPTQQGATNPTSGGLGGPAYGLDSTQYAYLGAYYAALQAADPTHYPASMSLDDWLVLPNTGVAPSGAGLTCSPTASAANFTAAQKLTAGSLPTTSTGDPGTAISTAIDATPVPSGATPSAAQALYAKVADVLKAQGINPPYSNLQLAEGDTVLVQMEQALYNGLPNGPTKTALGTTLTNDQATLKTVLTAAQNGGFDSDKTQDAADQTAFAAFLTAQPPAASVAGWMQALTTTAGSIGTNLGLLKATGGNPPAGWPPYGATSSNGGGPSGGPSAGATWTLTNASFNVGGNSGQVSGSGSWSSDYDHPNDADDGNDRDTGGSVSIVLNSTSEGAVNGEGPTSFDPNTADLLKTLLGGNTNLSTTDLSNIAGQTPSATGLPAGDTFTPPTPADPNAPSLSTQYTAAFGGSDTTSAFVAGMPGNLPLNANGQPYNPGMDPYTGADGQTHVLTADEEQILTELSSGNSPTIQLGPTPAQLTQQNNQQTLLNQINANNAPQTTGETVANQSGTFADFGNAVTDATGTLDSLGDMTTDMQMRMQLEQSQYSQIMEALSNIMKSMSQTSQTIVENLKT